MCAIKAEMVVKELVKSRRQFNLQIPCAIVKELTDNAGKGGPD